MKKTLAGISALVLAAALGTTAIGESHIDKALAGAIKARQAQMQLYAFNLGVLGAMAKGDMAYDATAASAAAGNLASLTQINQMMMWPAGSDNAALGDATGALPAIWAADSDIMAKGMALGEAAAAMNGAAGTSQEALQSAMAAVGGACGACHKAYRQAQN